MVSRESAFLLNNIVLMSALFTIFLGTVFPLISEAVAGVQVSVGAPYFNSVTVPLFLFLVFLMAVGPIIAVAARFLGQSKAQLHLAGGSGVAARFRFVRVESPRLHAAAGFYAPGLRRVQHLV
jgi:cytochrome c-type biogenesis protein CcmF